MAGGWIKLSHDRSTPPRNLKWWMLTILPIGICQALAMVRVLASLSAFHIITRQTCHLQVISRRQWAQLSFIYPHPPLLHIYTIAFSQGFGTVAYLSLTVAFIQMLKAFTPVITLIVLYAFGVEKPGKMLVM